jgi:uncharacterized protein (TIGR03089 family)
MTSDPAGPRITYYDDATGERIELSTATLVNWAAKTGNLLRDEMGVGPGSRVAVLLPAHWQTASVLFGIWWIGAEVVTGGQADVALCTAERLGEADEAVGVGEIAVLSLDPFGKPVPDLPVGLTDYATAVRVHGDQISPERDPGNALDGRSVDDVISGALGSAAAQGLTADDRVMSTAGWTTADDLTDHLLALFAIGASLVQVANPDSTALDRRRQMEKISRG